MQKINKEREREKTNKKTSMLNFSCTQSADMRNSTIIVHDLACCSCQHKAFKAVLKNMYTKWPGMLIDQAVSPTSFNSSLGTRWLVYIHIEQNLTEPQGSSTFSPGCLSSDYNQEESNIHFSRKGLRNELNNRYTGKRFFKRCRFI